MEVTALLIGLLINVLVLLPPALIQSRFSVRADATFPRIVPSRLQLFEYQALSVNCEEFFNELNKWRVMRKIRGIHTICNTKMEKLGPCDISTAFPSDSGEYWCETEGKQRSNSVNITVTVGSVILESPVLPVMEGENVTLRCIQKKTTSNLKGDFYKDGRHIDTSSTGQMTVHGVSKSDEGLYKCSIAGVGESAENWLRVTELHRDVPPSEHHVTSRQSYDVHLVSRTAFIVLLVALHLLLVGLLHCGKCKIIWK